MFVRLLLCIVNDLSALAVSSHTPLRCNLVSAHLKVTKQIGYRIDYA